MPAHVHPFTYHQEQWSRALRNLSRLETQARSDALGHIKGRVQAAARREGLSAAAVGVYWRSGRPRLHVEDGPTADAEFGTLSTPPRAALRNSARRADRNAAAIYQRRIWTGLGI